MASAVQTAIRNAKSADAKYSEKAAMDALYDELSKGIQSVKKGEVYTVEKAWEEIDKI